MKYVHINCDLGEGGHFDKELMPLVSACNIACGGHAGTLEIMHQTVQFAMEHHVEMGAHPSYPDKKNFGRRSLQMDSKDLKRNLVGQILSLKQIIESEGGKMVHVKPHGALYNDAAVNEDIAAVVVEAMMEFGKEPPSLYVPLNSVISKMAAGQLPLVFEAFADRNYNPDYSLVARSKAHSLITQKEAVFHHLSSMFFDKVIICANGKRIPVNADTFCLHSDTPDSVEILKHLHLKFRENQVEIFRS